MNQIFHHAPNPTPCTPAITTLTHQTIIEIGLVIGYKFNGVGSISVTTTNNKNNFFIGATIFAQELDLIIIVISCIEYSFVMVICLNTGPVKTLNCVSMYDSNKKDME